MKELNNNLHQLVNLLNEVIDRQNDLILANVTTYELLKLLAEDKKIKIPKPRINMDIE